MLPARHRLRSSQDIKNTLRLGRCFEAPYARVCFKVSSQVHSRVACIVGRAVSKSSVIRHRYQRWLREASRNFFTASSRPYDIVLVARPGITHLPSLAALKEDLNRRLSGCLL